jgi:molybdopterin-guanine dinucleotide biosynthesis protein A
MLTVAIQAGGDSLRMGQDKALMSFLGQPLIAHVLRRVAPIASEALATIQMVPKTTA